MKKFTFLTLLLMLTSFGYAQNDEWTLQECIAYALENNISIKQSELDLEMARVDKIDAIGNYLPRINASAINSWNTGLTQNVTTGILQTQTTRNFSAGVTAGITLFGGLTNLRELQRAKMARLASQYALDQMKDDISLFVANQYLQILFNKEAVKVIEAQHEVTLQQIERAEKLVEAGAIPEGDLLELKANAANEAQRIIVAQNAAKISLIALAQTLLIKDYEDFDIAEKDYEILGADILQTPVAQIIQEAKEERNEIKLARQNLELAEKDIQIARGGYYPTLTGFYNYNTRESGAGRLIAGGLDPDEPYRQIGFVQSTEEPVLAPNTTVEVGDPLPFFEQLRLNDGQSYGVQLTIPFLNGFSTRNFVQRRKIEARRAEYLLEQSELELEANVYQAYLDAEGAMNAYEAALIALEAQELAYNYATERYNVGLTTAFELRQAGLNLENARSELIRSKYDFIFAVKVLELYFGIPVELE